MSRVIIGGLVTGVVVFFWGAFAHMVLPIGSMGVRQIGNEEPVRAVVRDHIKEPGFYFLPGMDMSREASQSEKQAWEARVKEGPVGVLIIQPSGGGRCRPGNWYRVRDQCRLRVWRHSC